MNYKYKKNQIFGKRLKVPKDILEKVYSSTLTFQEFIEYHLEDKIPITCIDISDRKIVERFGIDRCKELDWELIGKNLHRSSSNLLNKKFGVAEIKQVLMTIDPSVEDINKTLYELVIDVVVPYDYSNGMKELYPDHYFDIDYNPDEIHYYDDLYSIKDRFNRGETDLKDIIYDWDFYKDKDLTICLKNDYRNKVGITEYALREFMSKYQDLVRFVHKYDDIYSFIYKITFLPEEEANSYIKEITDNILRMTYEQVNTREISGIKRLMVEDYKIIFKYSSPIDYLKILEERTFHDKSFSIVVSELEKLPPDFVSNMSFPISDLFDSNNTEIMAEYGIKNIVDFDNESGHFFSKYSSVMLYSVFDCFINADSRSKYPVIKGIDENGHYNGRGEPYTKEEFYECVKGMIMSITDHRYKGFRGTDYNYGQITGEFRNKYPELFIDDNAPEDVKTMFYTRSFTPKTIIEHPEYITYLKNKNIACGFKDVYVVISRDGSRNRDGNFYDFIAGKTDSDGVIEFIKNNAGIIEFIDGLGSYVFNEEDDLSTIENKMYGFVRKQIIQGLKYPSIIPDKMKNEFPDMFLPSDAPDKLKRVFYSREITTEFILSNPSYIEYLRKIDMRFVFKYMIFDKPVGNDRMINPGRISIVEAMKKHVGENAAFDVMLLYGKYIESSFNAKQLCLDYSPNLSREEFLNSLDQMLLKNITSGDIIYDEKMPNHFKKKNPSLFLDESLPKDIRDKFYDRKFTVEELLSNPDLVKQFGSTTIIFGLPKEYAWISNYFSSIEDPVARNQYMLRVAASYSKIVGSSFDPKFKEYIQKMGDKPDTAKIDIITELISRLDYSNSLEIREFRNSILPLLMESENPLEKLEKMEDVFLRNNTPLCGKMYLCFKILYPHFSDVKRGKVTFDENSRMAPEFKNATLPNVGFHATEDEKRFIIMFNDLLRVSYRSNERSLMEYLDNLEKGNKLYLNMQNNNFDISKLSPEEIKILDVFVSHLETLYDNTQKGKENGIDLGGLSLEEKLKVLGKVFKENDRYELKDRIVRTFCYYAGIKSYDELKKLTEESMLEQKTRTQKFLKALEENGGVFKFHKGDFVRAIGNLDAFSGSINTGNFSKEHLGVFTQFSGSDTTPLDVDLSYIPEERDVYHGIDNGLTGFNFGNLYIIMTKDNPNIHITRDSNGNIIPGEYDPTKIEIFGTNIDGTKNPDHWGARTGISLADVDCIVYKRGDIIDSAQPIDENGNVKYIDVSEEKLNAYNFELAAIKYEIAKNGYYIPVIDFSGKLIYTMEEYEQIRDKMQGLSHFGRSDYKLSSELISPDVEKIAESINQDSINYTAEKRYKIYGIINEVLSEMGLDLKCYVDGDLTSGSVEFIDTGSTGRNTNIPYDGDFDFYMRLDSNIISDVNRRDEFKRRLKEKIEQHSQGITVQTSSGDYRFKEVKIDDETTIDIDISFGVKTNKVTYSSDECLKDRLETIKKLYPEEYKYVVANIILAKSILKSDEVNAYKPGRTDSNQGGLGGIGVENWILQNGGSFIQASRSFVSAAYDESGNLIPFEEFKKKYEIWDFGENHFSARGKEDYLYDNFVSKNMNETGYKKMAEALKQYLVKVDNNDFEMDGRTI